MKNPKESASQPTAAIEWAIKHRIELLAVGLWGVALWSLNQTFSPSCEAMDQRFSTGVACSATREIDENNRVDHALQVGFSRGLIWPDGTVVIPEGQFFVAILNCPRIREDGNWIRTACSGIDIIP